MADPDERGQIARVVPGMRSTVWVKLRLGGEDNYFFASALPLSVYEIDKVGTDLPTEDDMQEEWNRSIDCRAALMRGAGYLNHRASIYRSKWDELPRATRKQLIATYTKKER